MIKRLLKSNVVSEQPIAFFKWVKCSRPQWIIHERLCISDCRLVSVSFGKPEKNKKCQGLKKGKYCPDFQIVKKQQEQGRVWVTGKFNIKKYVLKKTHTSFFVLLFLIWGFAILTTHWKMSSQHSLSFYLIQKLMLIVLLFPEPITSFCLFKLCTCN